MLIYINFESTDTKHDINEINLKIIRIRYNLKV